MALDQEGREIGRAAAAGTGDAVAVGDEQPVGDRQVIRELVEEILVMVPADAAFPPGHQAGAGKDEAAGAEPDQRHAQARRFLQIGDGLFVELRSGMEQTAHHDDVIELARIDEAARALDRDAAARPHRVLATRHHRPAAQYLPAAITLVRGEPKLIDEQRKGRQREMLRQHESDRQERLAGLGSKFRAGSYDCVRHLRTPSLTGSVAQKRPVSIP